MGLPDEGELEGWLLDLGSAEGAGECFAAFCGEGMDVVAFVCVGECE